MSLCLPPLPLPLTTHPSAHPPTPLTKPTHPPPQILLVGGSAFFGACIAYQHFFGALGVAAVAAGAPASTAAGGWLLGALVMGGALLFVFSRAAKFSLFKPAEEIVYLTLDENSRWVAVVAVGRGGSGGS